MMIFKMTEKEINRFWNSVSLPTEENGCMKWKKYKDKLGYGISYYNKKLIKAHRLSYILNNGDIPDGMVIRHNCHNRECVNPNHLLIGTHQDNMNDMKEAGRVVTKSKEQHPMAKLTQEQVNDIKTSNMKGVDLAQIYNVSKSLISAIRNKKLWKDETDT